MALPPISGPWVRLKSLRFRGGVRCGRCVGDQAWHLRRKNKGLDGNMEVLHTPTKSALPRGGACSKTSWKVPVSAFVLPATLRIGVVVDDPAGNN
jgi:hypothetical protein